jgi:hypothetical protein
MSCPLQYYRRDIRITALPGVRPRSNLQDATLYAVLRTNENVSTTFGDYSVVRICTLYGMHSLKYDCYVVASNSFAWRVSIDTTT